MCHITINTVSVSIWPSVNENARSFYLFFQKLTFFLSQNLSANHFYDQFRVFRLCFSSLAVYFSCCFLFLIFSSLLFLLLFVFHLYQFTFPAAFCFSSLAVYFSCYFLFFIFSSLLFLLLFVFHL